MRNLSEIDQSLITNAVACGVALAFLLGYPVFKYVKEFNRMSQTGKSVLEIIFITLLSHIGFLLLILGLSCMMNVVVGDATRFMTYAPKYGVAFIMGMYDVSGSFNGGANFWKTWGELTKIAIANPDTVSMVIKGALATIGLAISVLWFALLVYPIFCIFFPMFLAIRKNAQSNAAENTYLQKMSYGMIISISLIVLTYIHFLIASIYVSFQTNTNFSFWNQMTSIWSEILSNIP